MTGHDHAFDLPLFGSADGDYSNEVVGWACECGWQLFDGESVTWTAASNDTTTVSVRL